MATRSAFGWALRNDAGWWRSRVGWAAVSNGDATAVKGRDCSTLPLIGRALRAPADRGGALIVVDCGTETRGDSVGPSTAVGARAD